MHPDIEELYLHLDSSLPDYESESIEMHLNECEACRIKGDAIVEQITQASRIGKGLPLIDFDPAQSLRRFHELLFSEKGKKTLLHLYRDQLIRIDNRIWIVLQNDAEEFCEDNLMNLTRAIAIRFLQTKQSEMIKSIKDTFSQVYKKALKDVVSNSDAIKDASGSIKTNKSQFTPENTVKAMLFLLRLGLQANAQAPVFLDVKIAISQSITFGLLEFWPSYLDFAHYEFLSDLLTNMDSHPETSTCDPQSQVVDEYDSPKSTTQNGSISNGSVQNS